MSATLNIATSVLLARGDDKDCVSATPDKNGHRPPGSCDAFYSYYPSFAAAVALTLCFAVVTAGHFFLAFYHKKGFSWVLIMGSAWEFLSFGARAYSTKHQDKKGPFSISFMLFTLAPLWINAYVYMVAGRLIFCFHPERRVFKIKAAHIGKFFVLADIICFLIQLAGGFMTMPSGGDDDKMLDIGLKIMQAGLGLQQAFIFVFIGILISFHLTMRRMEASGWRDMQNRRWWLLVWVEYFTLILITVRIAYRLAEFIIPYKEHGNVLLKNEIYMYVLDAVPMFLTILAFMIFHPGLVLRGPGSNYRQDKKAEKAQAKAAKKAHKLGLNTPESESMIGVELHQPVGGGPTPPWLGAPTQYSPLSGQEHGVLGGGGETRYDPHHGRM